MPLESAENNINLKRRRCSILIDTQCSPKKVRTSDQAHHVEDYTVTRARNHLDKVDRPVSKAGPASQMDIIEPQHVMAIKSDNSEATLKACAVTGSSSTDIETCYIIPLDASADDIEQLEYVWGLQQHSLDIKCSSNMITLTPELRRAFDADDWALVPSDSDLVEKLRDFEVGSNGAQNIFDVYEKADEPMFAYDIVPLRGCKLAFGPADNTSPDYRPPYKALPQLSLPIYPHLMLVNLVAKFKKLHRREHAKARYWMSDNKPVLGYCLNECEETHVWWLPTREFEHEYAHLPPVDKVLDRSIGPWDSYSEVLERMGVFEGDEDEEEVEDRSKSFHATRTKGQICEMVEGWLDGVRKVKTQVDSEHCLQEASELPPSHPPSPLATSSGSDCSAKFDRSSRRPMTYNFHDASRF